MTRQQVLKGLMLGLIYPAVLGTVMFAGMQVAIAPVAAFVIGAETHALDSITWAKLTLLGITILFYCFDYLYITFTKKFDWPFFFCDLAFIVVLYVTVYAIDLEQLSPDSPHLRAIWLCYSCFMILYLLWDVYERRRCPDPAERTFYTYVILWELLSLGALAAAVLWLDEGAFGLRVTIRALAVITVLFGALTWWKKVFYSDAA